VKRRNFLKLGAAFAAMPVTARGAIALDYPTRPVQVIVGQAAASSSDITARLVSQILSQHLGQQFVVEVRPGATGNIATELVVRATPDGYTLLLVNSQNTINAALFPNLPFDFVRDIAPIAGVFRVPLVMEVLPSFPAQTVPEFIAYAKANPGKINMASAGVGGPQHVAGELFKFMAGVDLVHVPYHGSTPAITDLLAGQVQVMFDVTPTALPQVRAGKLRALAVTTARILRFNLVRPVGAEVHTERYCCQAQQRGRDRVGGRERQSETQQAWATGCRARTSGYGGFRGLSKIRSGQVVAYHQGSQFEG
jgi:tripartite-type tricarboxylate transporter receptor subunit TctC